MWTSRCCSRPKTAKFTALADLKGHKIGVTRSTTNDIALTKRAVEGTTIQRYDDDASTSQALLAGQVEGIVTSGGLAQVFSRESPNLEPSSRWRAQPMGIGLRRGEADLLHWLNTDDLHVVDDGRACRRCRRSGWAPRTRNCRGSDRHARRLGWGGLGSALRCAWGRRAASLPFRNPVGDCMPTL